MASFSSLFSLALAAFLCLSSFDRIEAQNSGFSIDLIHRDSPKSPFYNPLETRTQRIKNAARRSLNRAYLFNSNTNSIAPNSVQSTVTPVPGEYLMDISIGTPPFPIMVVADTGSDLIWTQCQPCSPCFPQVNPIFNPANSTTYEVLSCSSNQCHSLSEGICTQGHCEYTYNYGDGSHTYGDIATDTLTLGSTTGQPTSFTNTIIGCGHDSGGTFSNQISGIAGLGGGPESLVSQLSSAVNGKFSYCFVPVFSKTQSNSKLNFGTNAVVSGAGTVSTPIVPGSPKTFYFLVLEAITVGTTRVDFSDAAYQSDEGNIIIDSGTTLTVLPKDFYTKFESAVTAGIRLTRTAPIAYFNLCYKTGSDAFDFPNVVVNFRGADVKLRPNNIFVRVSEQTVCFAFVAAEGGAIYGNIAQSNFLIGYDTQQSVVSFMPTDCTKI